MAAGNAEYMRLYRARKAAEKLYGVSQPDIEAVPLGAVSRPSRKESRVPALEAKITELEEEIRLLKQQLASRPAPVADSRTRPVTNADALSAQRFGQSYAVPKPERKKRGE
jgi:hypothetical protein